MVSVRSCTNSPTQDTQEETGVSRSQTRKISQKYKNEEKDQTCAVSQTHTPTEELSKTKFVPAQHNPTVHSSSSFCH